MSDLNFEVIKRESQKDEVLRDMLHIFGDRERTLREGELSLKSFSTRAKKAGFEHAERDYARRIQFLADAGLGKLDKTDNGRVLGLKHVGVDVRSLAEAVLERDESHIKSARRRNKYLKFPLASPVVVVEAKADSVPEPIVLPEAKKAVAPALTIQVSMKSGQKMTIDLPAGTRAEAIAEVMAAVAKLTM